MQQRRTLTKTEASGTTTYTWDDEKRLIMAEVNGQQMQYRYNDQGIRVSSTVNGVETRYLLDEGLVAQVWEEYSPTNPTEQAQVAYVHGNDLISQTQQNETTYYLVDGLGSTRLLTDDQGTILNGYRYDAFGRTLGESGTTNNKYRFAGEQFDEGLGDYYLRQRFYDTSTGRFARRDTYEGRLGEPLTQHKYIYANDNPINYIDPSGLMSISEAWISLTLLEKIWVATTATAAIIPLGLGTIDAIYDFIDHYVPYFPIPYHPINDGGDSELDPDLKNDLEDLEDSMLEPEPPDPNKRKPSRGANKRDKEAIDRVAKEKGMSKSQRQKFSDYIHKLKKSEGRRGANNLGQERLSDLADEFMEGNY